MSVEQIPRAVSHKKYATMYNNTYNTYVCVSTNHVGICARGIYIVKFELVNMCNMQGDHIKTHDL